MTELLQIERAINPVTALAFLELDRLYLLVGEGCYLLIYDYETKEEVHHKRVFEEQTIHGIVYSINEPNSEQRRDLLVWGGRSIRIFCIGSARTLEPGRPLCSQSLLEEYKVDDWILDACFGSNGSTHAYFITAHNELYVFNGDKKCSRLASGPKSILYSAHVVWDDGGKLVVAAGTVFGEVLLWSTCISKDVESAVAYLHYSFTGHEGSVFGVRISGTVVDAPYRRLLASCSDDRTIRVWNISVIEDDMVSKHDNTKSTVTHSSVFSSECIASTMGHASRIWGVRFLGLGPDGGQILSHGEDATAQTWLLNHNSDSEQDKKQCSLQQSVFQHEQTYGYHSGKNLWTVAVFEGRPSGPIVANGGADGQVTSFQITERHVLQVTMDDVRNTIQPGESMKLECKEISHSLPPDVVSLSKKKLPPEPLRSPGKLVFDALEGSWKLSRRLQSAKLSYPSGTLEGGATFDQRAPTDEAFDTEYLYSEWGDFITDQGLVMKATRQYVYRSREDTDEVSVWFVKPEDKFSVDYLFHILDVAELEAKGHGLDSGHSDFNVTANGDHLCVDDNYIAEYNFHFNHSSMREWSAQFTVIGPQKDYVAKATYTRETLLNQTEKLALVPQISDIAMANDHVPPGFQLPKCDAFKTYVWINEHAFLTTTEQGYLLLGTLIMSEISNKSDPLPYIAWEMICHRTPLKSSCLATSVTALGIAFFSGTDGTVYVYRHAQKRLDYVHIFTRKLGYMRAQNLQKSWVDTKESTIVNSDEAPNLSREWIKHGEEHTSELVGVLTTCLGSSQADVVLICAGKAESGPPLRQHTVTLGKDFMVTSSCFVDNPRSLLLGSRKGDIAVYDLEACCQSITPTSYSYCTQLHKEAITAIEILPSNGFEDQAREALYLTASRDGTCAVHRLTVHEAEDSSATLESTSITVHRFTPPFGPNIEGIWLNPAKDEIFVWGFRSTKFIVWNKKQNAEVATVECGGAHRNWAYIPQRHGRGGGSFVWTKASSCNVHSEDEALHQVLQFGGHGREIKTIAISRAVERDGNIGERYIATGAEDTIIRIHDTEWRCVSILGDHTTGIQQLRWSKTGERLFSAAGCEEFFVWRVTPVRLSGGIGIVREAVCPRVTEDGDLRIMDFEVEVFANPPTDYKSIHKLYVLHLVYSDSSLRIFRYDRFAESDKFTLLYSGLYGTSCLTQVAMLNLNGNGPILVTTGTDGHIALWPQDKGLSQKNMPAVGLPQVIEWTTRTQVHENSIKCFDIQYISTTEAILATGGDDGALALTRITSTDTQNRPTHTTLLIPRAHASAVTAIALLGICSDVHTRQTPAFDFATVSNDQRVIFWRVSIDLEQVGVQCIKVKKIAEVHTSIADASSAGTYTDTNGQQWLQIAGIGTERWKIESGYKPKGKASQQHTPPPSIPK